MAVCCNCPNEVKPDIEGKLPLACPTCQQVWSEQKQRWGMRLLLDTGFTVNSYGVLVPPGINVEIRLRTPLPRLRFAPDINEDQPD